MNRRHVWIPVGWGSGIMPDPGKDPILSLSSHTLVLAVPHKAIEAPFEVARVPGSWSPHVPEKKPRYRITWGWSNLFNRELHRDVDTVRLGTVAVGWDILIPLKTKRPQICLNHKDQLHGVYSMDISPWTICGENPYLSITERTTQIWTRHVEPTCKACLALDAVWYRFTVWPYADKRVEIKAAKKERDEETKRLRLPTAYARILDDDLFENPTYKPVGKKHPALDHSETVDETADYEDTERDRKRASEIDRVRRFESSKAAVRGHRR